MNGWQLLTDRGVRCGGGHTHYLALALLPPDAFLLFLFGGLSFLLVVFFFFFALFGP